MANKISLYKKIKIFREFKKILRLNKTELEQMFGARVDNAYRIYNVINIPAEVIGEPYNLRKSDIDKVAETTIKEYSIKISEYLDSKGLKEMYEFYEIKKVDKYSYLLVLGFSLPNNPFRSNRYYDNLRYRVIPVVSLISLILLLIFLI
jgi:hypothetical protein